MAKGLTYTAIFEAMSLNYGEGVGNISELKKLTKGGEFYSYTSRQAIRYDIYRTLKESYNIDDKEDPLTKEQQVVQFKPDANIKDYVEMDLFGYMKTKKGQGSISRPAVVRISPAISLEPMEGDVEFGTNKNFADRAGTDPNPFQFEHHYSLYSYTVTVDLDRIGVDENDKIYLSPDEKAKRVNQLLEVLKVLTRNIKGRTESLSPIFAIGGVYDIKNPFFLNKLKVNYSKEEKKYGIDTEILDSQLSLSFDGKPIRDYTYVGYLKGYWLNESEFNKLSKNVSDIDGFFSKLKDKVLETFGSK
ncbi:MAG: type I-B CRISPR-associated protein Cas7/Cst2/DevR [Caldisericum sp.]|jgi:CRISPR-associated protein Cst2|nr:type I-B CRISPR-associated protein Cas7/Cst2/DevR [Caldisericum sp.]